MVRAAPEKKLRPRVNGVLVHRMERLRGLIESQLMEDARTVALSRHAFKDDLELATSTVNGRYLTPRQKRIARAWEMSKKEAPIALQVAHDRLVNAQRAQQETKSLSINVERAVIRVPDTKQDAIEDAVIIDAEVGIASR